MGVSTVQFEHLGTRLRPKCLLRAGTIHPTVSCHTEGLSVVEMLFRLGFALLLSLSLALLLAWGWSSSDERTETTQAEVSTDSVMPAKAH